ncbi:MAG: GIY-YIG nuclease family protein [Candidatus Portnoybacteria bacterium]|nr:GIY-YIG nuclease family protein [Candidatus Portnoybacteria bacterium]
MIENPKGKKYTGSTNDLNKRLDTHNDETPEKAKFHRTTFKKGPWKIIFKKEFTTRKEAIQFERFLKTGKGREWLEQARRGG